MRFVKTVESIFDIPSNFTRVEYLQSTGTQYIDTGIKGKNNIDFDYKCIFTNLDGTAQCVGGNWSGETLSSVSLYLGLIRTSGNFAYHYDGTSSPIVVMNTTVQDTIYSIQGHMWVGEQYMVINGTKSSTGTIASTFTSSLNMYLFGLNNNGLANPAYMKLYYCKIYDNGTLVRDFIPCIDPLGRACMYDLVGKKAYYNQGTGEFTVGRQVIPVEYLESTGEQYIDTGYKPVPATTKLEFYFSPTNISGNYFLFGARPDNAAVSQYTCTAYFSFGAVRQDWAGINASFPTTSIGNKYLYTAYNNTVSLNTDTVTGTNIRSTTRSDYNFLLFTVNTAGTADSRRYIGRVYYAKLWDDGTLVRDFIPCKDENNVGFMFDILSGTVYENAGTGTFAVGSNVYKTKLRLIRDNVLPTGYTQVEYLKSTGTQYIDTDYIPQSNVKIETDFQLTEIPSDTYATLCGSLPTEHNYSGLFVALNYTVPIQARTGSNSNPNIISTYSVNTDRYKLVLEFNKLTINGNVFTPIRDNIWVSLSNPLYFFSCSGYDMLRRKISAKMWYFKVYAGDTLVRDFIPAIDPSGTPCMYDLVSRTPFYNQGTGTFTTGKPLLPVVRFPVDPVPVGYKTVNYLGSDSTAYIDTGVSGANNNLKIEMNFSYSKFYTYGYLFSNYESEQHDTTRFLLDASNNSRGLAYINTKSQNGAIYTPYNLTMNDKHNLVLTKTTVSIDGVTATNTNPPVGTANTKNIILFNRGAGSYADKRDIGMRCWSFKIYDNNTLVRNFIPVIRLVDNKAGMWDTVTKQFYTTPVGDFITG